MNAEPAVQLLLLDVQGLDVRLDQSAHRRRNLPEHARITVLEARLATLRDRLVASQAEVSDLNRAQTKADADVEQVRQRAQRDSDLLQSGKVSSPRELENLQHEVASLARRQSDLEDVELEIMERLENARAAGSALMSERTTVQSNLDEVMSSRDTAYEEIDRDNHWVGSERTRVASRISADLLALYEKLRADNAGIGAAPMHQGRCEGCRMQLTPVDLSRIRNAEPDEVLRCEECRRILVRTAESGL